jgi:hypothetical protein
MSEHRQRRSRTQFRSGKSASLPAGEYLSVSSQPDTKRADLGAFSDLLRGVNYFRRLATTISAGQGQQRVSPTTWRYTVVVVGRLVAVENVSAGAPIGA